MHKIPLIFDYRNGKHFDVALILSIFLGMFGIDRFYLGYPAIGCFKLFTLGFMFLGQLIDVILSEFMIAFVLMPTRFTTLSLLLPRSRLTDSRACRRLQIHHTSLRSKVEYRPEQQLDVPRPNMVRLNTIIISLLLSLKDCE
jgi:TM2 domain-containing membrane protein YozV